MLGAKAEERLLHGLLEDAPATAPATSLAPAAATGEPLVRLEGLTVPGAVENVSFTLWPGEVLGLGGLVGSGRTTILRALAGLEPRAIGRLWIDGRQVPLPRTVRQARRLGIALIPEDRKGQGLVLQMDAKNNIALGDLGAVSRFGLLSRRRMVKETARFATDFGFRAERIEETARNLSGGNQQKLLLARGRMTQPRVLLADEPTRGIDIGAKAEIMASLETMAADGLGIVVVSSELEEVCAMSDRIVVLAEGRHAATLDRRVREVTPSRIMATAFGLEDDDAAA
jgi:ABC-type sugar transport system ATPase subunit